MALLALVAGDDVEPGRAAGWVAGRPTRSFATASCRQSVPSRDAPTGRDRRTRATSRSSRNQAGTAHTITPGDTSDGDAATDLLAHESEPVEMLTHAAYGGGRTRILR